ncbi:MAG TPA: ABC transporter permease subunit [Acidimicrobiales bacterium]|nr:ABC transporter permease subunit [Acidimicrobiales bacterium]
MPGGPLIAGLFEWSALPAWSTVRADLVQHIELSVIAVAIGSAIALPLGVATWRYRFVRLPVFAFSSALYVLPSLALFVIILPVTGIGSVLTAEVALVGYTLLILVMNVVAGLEAVPPDVREATAAMGYSPTAALVRVDLALALPYLVGGLRIATTTVVGLVTVTALIGLGGLGRLITTGFNADNSSSVLAGLVLSVALAAAFDLLLVGAEKLLVPWSRARRRSPAGARA